MLREEKNSFPQEDCRNSSYNTKWPLLKTYMEVALYELNILYPFMYLGIDIHKHILIKKKRP